MNAPGMQRQLSPAPNKPLHARDLGLVLWTTSSIRICLIFLCQGKPHPRHLQENDSVLFILSGSCHF
jgi:hypothetical protein